MKPGDKVPGFVDFMEHTEDDTADRLKKAVQKGTVFKEKMAQFFIYGEDTVPVGTLDQFEGHLCRAFLTVFHATGRTKTAFAAEGNKFHVMALWTDIHGAAVRRVTAMDHFFHVFYY